MLEWLLELRQMLCFPLQFYYKGYKTAKWKRCMGQGWTEGGTMGNCTQTFHAFSEHITHPAPPNVLQPGSSLKPHFFRVSNQSFRLHRRGWLNYWPLVSGFHFQPYPLPRAWESRSKADSSNPLIMLWVPLNSPIEAIQGAPRVTSIAYTQIWTKGVLMKSKWYSYHSGNYKDF